MRQGLKHSMAHASQEKSCMIIWRTVMNLWLVLTENTHPK